MKFTKEQIALFISITLHIITGTFYIVLGGREILLSTLALPKAIIILITVLWAIVDLILVYRVVVSMTGNRAK